MYSLIKHNTQMLINEHGNVQMNMKVVQMSMSLSIEYRGERYSDKIQNSIQSEFVIRIRLKLCSDRDFLKKWNFKTDQIGLRVIGSKNPI